MSDQQLEDVVRAAFRRHEHLVDGDRLLPTVQARIIRRRHTVHIAAASATGVVLAASAAGVLAFGPDRAAQPTDRTTPTASNPATVGPTLPAVADSTPPPVPPGWTAYSSRGAEIVVPSHWPVNNYGCGMDARPSVVRAKGMQFMCLTPEPQTKELAILGGPDVERPGAGQYLRERAIRVDGLGEAYRADGRLPDGRWAGWVRIPSHDVLLVVRTRSAATTGRILDSIRLVNTDRLGCASNRPAADRPAQSGVQGSFVPADPRSITICYYETHGPAVLAASTRLTGTPAKQLADALNQAKPGPNADRPSPCEAGRPGFNAELRVTGADGQTTTVFVRFEGCTGRGLDNGTRQATVTQTIIHRTLQPLHVGYAFDGNLPQ